MVFLDHNKIEIGFMYDGFFITVCYTSTFAITLRLRSSLDFMTLTDLILALNSLILFELPYWQYVETVLTNQIILHFFLKTDCTSLRILFSLNNQNTIPWNIMEWFHQKMAVHCMYWKCPNHMYHNFWGPFFNIFMDNLFVCLFKYWSVRT